MLSLVRNALLSALVTAALIIPAVTLAAVVTPATVSGSVHTADGSPVASASVVLRGASNLRTATDAQGAFTFSSVTPGEYTLVVAKAGFQNYENDNVLASVGGTTSVAVVLVASSFTSLRTIASVSTRVPGRAQINTSTAAITTISNQVFEEQGATQVTKILNETPGIISAASPESGNGASEGSFQNIQIRGALPYETEQLIDGHPTTLSLGGTYDPIYLQPGLLQDVEVVKGPGSMPEEINYAIGGTVNYMTLQPTRTPQASADFGVDNWGGMTATFRATGSTKTHAIDYAFGYATNGAPGPLKNYKVVGSQIYLIAGAPPWTLNGQQVAEYPEQFGPYPPSSNYTGIGGAQLADPIYLCCDGINTAFYSRGELGKLRFNFSPFTSLTVSYLGGQAFNDEGGMSLTSLAPIGTTGGSFAIFSPPPGYSGAIGSGTPIPFDLQAFLPQFQSVQQNLYQGELRTSFAGFTLLGRYFTAADRDYDYVQTAADGSLSFSGNAYGGILLCPPGATSNPFTGTCSSGTPTMTFFNGQTAVFKTTAALNTGLEQDHLRGESILLEHPLANGDDFSLSVDQAHHDSTAFTELQTVGPGFYTLPPGASQNFTTEMLRGHFFLAPRVFAGVADYFMQYKSHFTDDGGTTWQDATRAYNAPRLGVTWRPNPDVSWRLGMGSSIAPPQLGLLSSSGTQPLPNITGAPTYYTQNLNNGSIAPETAWGYDLGVDKRIEQSMQLSIDLYQETLRDEFLSSTSLIGTYQGLPLYASQTANLGHARYSGIEFALLKEPAAGWGFKFQGDLQRAYAYDLPPYFYCSIPGPGCTQDSNLGIVDSVNFGAGGLGFNTLNGSAVPYSMGYGEINHRSRYGTYFLAGLTYYGSNNSFSRPAFVIASAAVREPLREGLSVQLSVDNLFNTYGQSWTNYFGGIPTGLVNGQLGPTVGGNYGPATWRLIFSQDLGPKTGP